jgi:hypothetical protein
MRQKLRSHLTYANVMVTLLAFIVLGGTTLAATGGNFILGQPNSASSTTALSAGTTGPAFRVTNTSTGTGGSFNVASGHAPFTVNSGTKVTNLNADKLDGLDSTQFVSNSNLRRVGPFTDTEFGGGPPFILNLVPIGHFAFLGKCGVNVSGGGNDEVGWLIASDVDHSAYASMTQDEAGRTFGEGDMAANSSYSLADITIPTGTPDFNPVSGSAVDPNGQEVVFNLYAGINVRNHPKQCIFGGSLAVK